MRTVGRQQKLLWSVGTFWLLTGLFTVVAVGMTATAQAQFGSPPGQGKPRGTAGGGSRPGQTTCLENPGSGEALVAMAPTQFVGLTSHPRPGIWVQIPQTTAKVLEFSLFTDQQAGVYQANLPISIPGLMQIVLPSEVSLTPNKPYQWTVALVCNPNQRTEDWIAEGWIQHQPLNANLQQQLSHATLEQQIRLYTLSGFWYEALNTYLTLQQTQPENSNLASLQADLLKSAGLPAIANPSPKQLLQPQANR